ncbi:MAG: carbamate kinase [Acidobacteriota bacterium]|nr:carbamate kinase [Acidobacteriota bacterium]
MRKALLAFGGNALIRPEEDGLQKDQLENAKESAEMVINLLSQGLQPVIVHGNGPQVGNILIQQEEAGNRVPSYTMDVCGAQTQGSMGYLLQRSIENMLKLRKLPQRCVTVLTEVVCDARDPGFQHPSKPVGPFYEAFRGRALRDEKEWVMKEDSGRGWRRLVPSPKPLEIVQIDAIRTMVEKDYVVLACGGGGIPVIKDPSGYYVGVEAVIDKDLTSALLGHELGCEVFIILTGVEKVAVDFGKPTQRNLDRITVAEARQYMEEGQFPPGSMGPKIQAAINYVEGGGEEVLITTAEALLTGKLEEIGTRIVSD